MLVEAFSDANRWADRLRDLGRELRLTASRSPTNLAEVSAQTRAEVADGRTVSDPILRYVPIQPDAIERIEQLHEQMSNAGSELDPHLTHVIGATTGTLAWARMFDDRSSEAVRAYGHHEHGMPDAALLGAAREQLASAAASDAEAATTTPTVSDREAADAIEGTLRRHGCDGWTVVLQDGMAARMSVNSLRHEVRVRRGVSFTPDVLRGLIVHEVGTHVFRSVNGARQPLTLLARGLPGYGETEEGLATYHEQRVGVPAARLRTFALRVVAAQVADAGSFREVLTALLDHAPIDEALPVAIRAKRGLIDTSAPGSTLKDVSYLRGSRAVAAHLRAHPADGSLLMSGKFGLRDLDYARDLQAAGLLASPVVDVDAVVAEQTDA